jgi:uncharacterized membrane protein YagU involved in acid resistance
MSKTQRKLIAASLIVMGLALAFVVLGLASYYPGIDTWQGVVGIVFGIVVPFVLLAIGAFVALGPEI